MCVCVVGGEVPIISKDVQFYIKIIFPLTIFTTEK